MTFWEELPEGLEALLPVSVFTALLPVPFFTVTFCVFALNLSTFFDLPFTLTLYDRVPSACFTLTAVNDTADFFSLLFQGQYRWQRDGLSDYELSMFFTTFVMLQFWNLFNARAFLTGRSAFDLRGCKEFLFIAALIFFGQILIVEFGGKMFNVKPMQFDEWVGIILITSPVLLLGEGVRYVKEILKKR